jgi:hypothetical protein
MRRLNLWGPRPEKFDRMLRRLAPLLLAIGLPAAVATVLIGPVRTLILLVGLAAVALAFLRPSWLILALAAYTPFEPFLLKFVPDDYYVYARYGSEAIIYILVGLVLARLVLGGQKRVPTPLDVPFLGLLVVAAASLAVNAVDPTVGLLGLRQIIRFMLIFFAAVNLDLSPRFAKTLTAVMLGIMVMQSALGLIQAGARGALDEFLIPSERKTYESIQLTAGTDQFWSPGTRVFATMGRYDQLGAFLCFFMLLVVGIYYARRGDADANRPLIVMLVAAPALFLTLSRASWFGFLIGLFIVGGLIMKDWRVRYAYAGVAVAAALYLGWSGLVVRHLVDTPQQTAVERVFEAFSYERWRGEYYGLGRLYWIVQTPAVVVRSSPILGVGPAQFGGGAAAALGNTAAYDRLGLPFGVQGYEGHIDNNWFSVWGELGTLGLAFYAWMVGALAFIGYRTWRLARSRLLRGLALGYVGAVAAVGFQAFLATFLEVRTLALYLWLFGALIYLWARREKVYDR